MFEFVKGACLGMGQDMMIVYRNLSLNPMLGFSVKQSAVGELFSTRFLFIL